METFKRNLSKFLVAIVFALAIAAIPFLNMLFENNSVGEQFESRNKYSTTATSGNSAEYVYISGKPIGIIAKTDGLIVVAKGVVETENGTVSPLKDVDLKKGDIIKSVCGQKVDSLFSFRSAVAKSKNGIRLEIERSDKTHFATVLPAKDKLSGEKRLGLNLKEDIRGLGTLTFVTENGEFGSLGHKIYDPETGIDQQLCKGSIIDVTVDDVIKGEKGHAGGLKGDVNPLKNPIGKIVENTDIGLYGKIDKKSKGAKIGVAEFGEARMGKAQILSTISGDSPKFYDINIVKVVSQQDTAQKGLVIAVTDKELIKKTGGIVQGMSGSPIVQNGKLIGAVTHVFVNDPERGYGVHSRFMVDKTETLGALDNRADYDVFDHRQVA